MSVTGHYRPKKHRIAPHILRAEALSGLLSFNALENLPKLPETGINGRKVGALRDWEAGSTRKLLGV
jgi:hypothetical protein